MSTVSQRFKRVNQATTQPLSENANDLIKALHSDELAIEHVFATNMNNVRNESNKYYFQYPGEWITANMKHVIGVRGIHLVKTIRWFFINVRLFDGSDKQLVDVPYEKYIMQNESLYDFIEKFNKDVLIQPEFQRYKSFLHAGYKNNVMFIVQNRSESYPNHYYTIEFSGDIMRYVELPDRTLSFKNESVYYMPIKWDRYENVELRASFVKQTEYQHLGFTNSIYNPLKQYELESADNEFWIELYSNDQQRKIILPDDNKDMIVIEVQLSLKPLI